MKGDFIVCITRREREVCKRRERGECVVDRNTFKLSEALSIDFVLCKSGSFTLKVSVFIAVTLIASRNPSIVKVESMLLSSFLA